MNIPRYIPFHTAISNLFNRISNQPRIDELNVQIKELTQQKESLVTEIHGHALDLEAIASERDELTEQKNILTTQLESERAERDRAIQEKIEPYLEQAREQIVDLQRGYQEATIALLSRELTRIPKRKFLKALGLPKGVLRKTINQEKEIEKLETQIEYLSSGILPQSAELLAETLPRSNFARSPIMIYSERARPYISKPFRKVCKDLGSGIEFQVNNILKKPEVAETLDSGKPYSEIVENVELTFTPYRLNKSKKIVSTVVSAVPIKSESYERAHNIFSELTSEAVDQLKKVWRGFNDKLKHATPILDYS